MICPLGVMFARQFILQPGALIIGQPLRLMWPVSQIENCDYAKAYGGQSLDDKQPAPSVQTEPVRVEQQTGQRRTDNVGHRQSGHEDSDYLAQILVTKPVTQIDDYTWEETRFR